MVCCSICLPDSVDQDMEVSLLQQSTRNSKKIENTAKPPSPTRSSTEDDENDETTWTWTPPSEEDILNYMREQSYMLRQTSESQEKVTVSNTPMAGGFFKLGDMFIMDFV